MEDDRTRTAYTAPGTATTIAPVMAGPITRETATFAEPSGVPFSFAAGFLGWGTATFFTLALIAVVLGVLGDVAYDNAVITDTSVAISQTAFNSLAWAGIIAGLVCVFVGYFVGGYNAGRIDRYHGASQGAMIVGWTILFAIIGSVVANAAARAYNVGNYLAPYSIDWAVLTTRSIIGLALTVLVMLAGAMLGGLAAPRWAGRVVTEERRVVGRGRPRY